jgi:Ca2+-transporting ATPase
MAYRDVEEWPPSEAGQGEDGKVSYDDVAKELTLLSIPAIEDPLREGVVDAVKKCHIAGVSVKMCTGDNVLTAKWVTRSSDRVGLTAGLQGHRTAMWDLP